MNCTHKRRSAVISLLLGATLSQASLASVIHDYASQPRDKGVVKFDGDSHASVFGKYTSENAKHSGSAANKKPHDGAGSNHDWTTKPIDWRGHEYKWDNHQSHLDDDKWDKHKNGKPGPIDNVCKSKHCEVPPPAVPVPAAVWLLGSGLIGLLGLARRRIR